MPLNTLKKLKIIPVENKLRYNLFSNVMGVLLSEISVPTYFDKMVFCLLCFTLWRVLSQFCLHTLVHEEIFIVVLQSQFHLLKIL